MSAGAPADGVCTAARGKGQLSGQDGGILHQLQVNISTCSVGWRLLNPHKCGCDPVVACGKSVSCVLLELCMYGPACMAMAAAQSHRVVHPVAVSMAVRQTHDCFPEAVCDVQVAVEEA